MTSTMCPRVADLIGIPYIESSGVIHDDLWDDDDW
jgi:hypothetical protein